MQVVAVHPGSDLFEAFLDLRASSKEGTRRELSSENPFFSHGQAQAFVCLEGANVIGRIVASIDDKRVDEPGAGHFGYFECIESTQAARRLLKSALTWVRSKGRQSIEGPVDLNIWTRYRIQVSGFEQESYLGEPRSPPYYARLLAACGLRERMRWHSYDFDRAELADICDCFSHRRASKYKATELRRVPWNHDDLYDAVMGSWSGNYGFSDIEAIEFSRALAPLLEILDPAQCFFFRDATSVCAFGIGHLDPKPRRAIIKAYGIIPAYRKTHLIHEILRDLTWHALAVARLPAVLSLATEHNDPWRRFKTPTRVHAIYGKNLAV